MTSTQQLAERRDAKASEATAIIDRIECEQRLPSAEEKATVQRLVKEAQEAAAMVKAQNHFYGFVKQIEDLVPGRGRNLQAADGSGRVAGSWAEAVEKQMGDTYGRVKALTSGTITVPSLSTTLVRLPNRPPTLLDVIPTEQVSPDTGRYAYLQQTVNTQNAAVVANSALKPTSVYTVQKVEGAVTTIAHLSEQLERQMLSDVRLFQDFVSGSLRDGVIMALEGEIIAGDGTGAHLLGLSATSGIQTQAKGADPTPDTLRKAITKLQLVNLASGFFLIHPSDWEEIELLRTADGLYISRTSPDNTPPVDTFNRTAWGVPVVVTAALTAGTGYLVDTGSVMLFEREGVQVDWSENIYDSGAGATDFQRNLIRFRAEGRWGFGVTRPGGVCKITGI